MKTIILVLFLTCLSFAQMNGKWVFENEYRTYTDSLQFQTDAVASKDSVWILNLNFNPDAVKFYIKGNANSTVDTVIAQLGYDVYNESGAVVQTNYGSITALKDSGWNTVNYMINNTVGKDFSLFNFSTFNKIKLTLKNYRAAVPTRKIQVTVQAWKRPK
jgi:hypothetical protein